MVCIFCDIHIIIMFCHLLLSLQYL
ncbi:hypothetical protein NP493_1048g00040 [Ridgeia piscesae]|uniref:Uncharacterized protein n=1 Tax=Ridgeia piscesae TaxID=27915 RepID=A0AAD9KHC9_RIDPI|nr:hypothetical protein NP493_1048g00040 [Ridgeia piscesae]